MRAVLCFSLLLAGGPGRAAAGAPSFSMFDSPVFAVVNPRVGTRLSRAAFEDAVSGARVVYAGEVGGSARSQLARLEILDMMVKARGRVAVGLEMVPSGSQRLLDGYLAGRIPEKEFLSGSAWSGQAAFTPYKPLFVYIREHKLKVLALDLPRGLPAKLAQGGIASLDRGERAMLPQDIRMNADKPYLAYLKRSFYAGSAAKRTEWENYLFSISAWNAALAARIICFLGENPDYSLLVLTGNGRIMYNAGVPARIKSAVPGISQVSVYVSGAAAPGKPAEIAPPPADYIWFTGGSGMAAW